MRQRGFNRFVLLGTVAAAWTSLENVELIEGVAPEHVRLAVVALLALLPALGRRKGHPERLGAAGAVRSPHHAAHRRRLVAFYEKNAPEKINDVDAILAKYLGREDALFARLEQKYAPAPARASPRGGAPAPPTTVVRRHSFCMCSRMLFLTTSAPQPCSQGTLRKSQCSACLRSRCTEQRTAHPLVRKGHGATRCSHLSLIHI